jgi:hypothetical protein
MAIPLGRAAAPGCDEPASRCQTPSVINLLQGFIAESRTYQDNAVSAPHFGTTMTNTLRLLTILIFALGVNACGGGGGSSSSLGPADATVVINSSNAIGIIRSVDDTSAIAEGILLDTVIDAASISSATVSAANNTDNLTARAAAPSTEYCTSGTADITTYGVHGFDGDGFTETHFGSDVLTLVNEEGSWSGRGISALLLDDTNNPTVMEATWHLTGEGVYEGLTAYLNVRLWEFVEGVIVEGTSATLELPAE